MNILAVALAFIVAVAFTGFKSYEFGRETMKNEIAADEKKKTDAAIEEANNNAIIDMQAAAEAERSRQEGLRRSQERRHAIELEIAQQEANTSKECSLACDLDPAFLDRLRDHIATVNAGKDSPQAPGGGDNRVPADPAPAKR